MKIRKVLEIHIWNLVLEEITTIIKPVSTLSGSAPSRNSCVMYLLLKGQRKLQRATQGFLSTKGDVETALVRKSKKDLNKSQNFAWWKIPFNEL